MEIYKRKDGWRDCLIFEGIQNDLRWTNFAGNEDPWHNTSKNFRIRVPEDKVQFLKDEGIRVKEWMPKDSDDPNEVVYTIKVNVSYKNADRFPVRVFLDSGNRRVELGEDQLHLLDELQFDNVDIKCSEYRGKDDPTSASLYLSEGYFTRTVDEFEERHRLPEDEPEEIPFN